MLNNAASYGLMGTKKFMRKRESSNQSLRRSSGVLTPKSKDSINQEKGENDRESKGEETKVNAIIKGNSFIKWFQSPTSKKLSQSMNSISAQLQK